MPVDSPKPRILSGAEFVAQAIRSRQLAGYHDTLQRCIVCAKPYSPFGFGLPPKPIVWTCRDHRDAGERHLTA